MVMITKNDINRSFQTVSGEIWKVIDVTNGSLKPVSCLAENGKVFKLTFDGWFSNFVASRLIFKEWVD